MVNCLREITQKIFSKKIRSQLKGEEVSVSVKILLYRDYLEHCQTSLMERSAKKSLVHDR